MSSDIEICNLALSRVAVTKAIASFTERSIEAEQCRVLYPHLRGLVLQEFPWPFAESIVALASLGSPAPGWAFRYRYPADCLKIRNIVQPGFRRALSSDMEIPYQIGYDAGGRVIHTDQPEAVCRFTFKVEDSTFFDALFVEALAWRLAMDLALPLTSKADLQQFAAQQYQMALTLAEGSAFQESQSDPEPESEFVTVRA
ncbi:MULTISPECIES: hypothetical protein [unclassified Pseudomonas]|jgi:hypothetical protein|uniref:hypothetical protein n=1 Tax=unclassified Pseudomonas TaxID=196821 RepID=UPI0019092FBF|nr:MULTISPECIES: hypothetical protein [unclassified Pseudomonas]MBK3439269.1 hypothetical protein [Pseudomonas sp. MF7448]QYM70642.1 hypothetical protein K1X80_10000 [Pseudomonas sp. So3.2b]